MTIGENMRQLREEIGYSLKQVEERTGINNGNLSRYERDLNLPSIEWCIKLADLYGVSVDELIGRSNHAYIPVTSPTDPQLSKNEKKLIEKFRDMRLDLQAIYLGMADTLLQTPESLSENNQKKKY